MSNERPDICAACGGKCCLRAPGVSFPEDWGLPGEEGEERLAAALASGRWKIAWTYKLNEKFWSDDWDAQPHESNEDLVARWDKELDLAMNGRQIKMGEDLLVYPAHKGVEGDAVAEVYYGGPCGFLSKRGCELSFLARPRECRALEPSKFGLCEGERGAQQQAAVEAWRPYGEFLRQLAETKDILVAGG